MFGDNNADIGVIRDPGVPGELLPVLGNETVAGAAGTTRIIRIKGVSETTVFGAGAGAGGDEKNGIKFPPSNAIPQDATLVLNSAQTTAGFMSLEFDAATASAKLKFQLWQRNRSLWRQPAGVARAEQKGTRRGRDEGDQEGRNTAEMGVNKSLKNSEIDARC